MLDFIIIILISFIFAIIDLINKNYTAMWQMIFIFIITLSWLLFLIIFDKYGNIARKMDLK